MKSNKYLAIIGLTLTKENRIFVANLLKDIKEGGANEKRTSGKSPQKE